ncbi:hypothetical protein BZA70DRAFT_250585 [Myxozyma melibiosi]|uniref:NADPH:adrenodoxin oxidoreductase, mitochondrial n=1 Tax=Myxozyma melibiosi TaxID=54550 RepID=A0ABR1F199_9ASCO
MSILHSPQILRASWSAVRRIPRASPALAHRWNSTVSATSTQRPLRVAIVGSGPAGFYTAYRILERTEAGAVVVDMFEKLPVPFGLARFGVAPDHPEVKNCQEKFEEVAESPYFNFFGNTAIGPSAFPPQTPLVHAPNQIPLSLLRRHYDAVILAYGADSDKMLSGSSFSGSTLDGVYSARQFVGWYNGHPEFQHLKPDLVSGDTAVVVGHGNVALDVARILLTDIDVLRKTDITSRAIDTLSASKIKHVKIVGRRGPAQASFTNKEVRELMTLGGVGYIPPPEEIMRPFAEGGKKLGRVAKRLLQLLERGSTLRPEEAAKTFEIEFLRSPAGFTAAAGGGEKLGAAVFDLMRLAGDPLLKETRVEPTGERVEVPCTAAFLSIGYKTHPLAGLEQSYDDRANHLLNELGKVSESIEGRDAKLYASGWIKRGPVGVIAETMYDAFETASTVIEDFETGTIGPRSATTDSPRAGWDGVRSELGGAAVSSMRIVSWGDWQKIDRVERELGKRSGKEREKIVDVETMLKTIE